MTESLYAAVTVRSTDSIKCDILYYPAGTGNDFLNDIGQKDNSSLIDIREYINNLPVGEVNGKTRRFINGVGFGLDGEVCLGVEEFKKKTNRKANYTTIALKLLMFAFKRPSARVTVDGVTKEYSDVWAISTMHGKYYGGGLMVAPTQDRNSGKLSVMVMHGGTRLKALTLFSRLSDGGHIKCKEIVEIIEGDEVLVESDSPCALQMDGEVEVDVTAYSARSAAAVRREAQEAATQKTAAEV